MKNKEVLFLIVRTDKIIDRFLMENEKHALSKEYFYGLIKCFHSKTINNQYKEYSVQFFKQMIKRGLFFEIRMTREEISCSITTDGIMLVNKFYALLERDLKKFDVEIDEAFVKKSLYITTVNSNNGMKRELFK